MEQKKNHKLSVVQETQYGVYVWITADNKIVVNENGDYLSVAAKENDLIKMSAIAKAAKYWGIEGGRPLFLPGRRKITDEEYEEQKARLKAGLTPDPYDAPALRDEIRDRRTNS